MTLWLKTWPADLFCSSSAAPDNLLNWIGLIASDFANDELHWDGVLQVDLVSNWTDEKIELTFDSLSCLTRLFVELAWTLQLVFLLSTCN